MKRLVCLVLFALINFSVRAQCWETVSPVPTSSNLAGVKVVSPDHYLIGGQGAAIFEYQNGVMRQMFIGSQTYFNSIAYFKRQASSPATVVAMGWIPTGAYLTTNQGQNWRNLNLPGNAGIKDIDQIDQQTAVAVGQNGKFYKTTDRGASWISATVPGASHLHGVSFVGTQLGYAAGFYRDIYKTTDGGIIWLPTAVTTNSTANLFFFMDIKFIDAQVGFACGSDGEFMKTTDGGMSWQSVNFNLPNGIHYMRNIVSPRPGQVCVIGDNGKCFSSNDSGRTWVNNYQPNVNFQAADANEGVIIAVAGSGTLVRSYDNGFTWDVLSKTYNRDFYDCKFLTTSFGLISGNKNSIYRTFDGGISTQRLDTRLPDTTIEWRSLTYTPGGRWVAGGSSGKIIYSDDHGQHWEPAITNSTNEVYYRFAFPATNLGWAAGASGDLWHTTNAGADWSVTHNFNGYTLRGIWFNSARTGFLVGDSLSNMLFYGRIWRTQDSGRTWQRMDDGVAMMYDVQFTDSLNGYVVGGYEYSNAYYGYAIKTSDGGTTWNQILGNWDILCKIQTFTQGMLAVGFMGRGMISTNSGQSWGYTNTGVTSRLVGMSFVTPDTGYVVGYNSTILRYRCQPLGQPTSLEPVLPQDASGLQLVPNPASDLAALKLSEPGYITNVVCYNTAGQVTEVVYDQTTQTILLNKVPSGLYLVKASSSSGKLYLKRLLKQ